MENTFTTSTFTNNFIEEEVITPKRAKVLSRKVAPASNAVLCELEHEKMSKVSCVPDNIAEANTLPNSINLEEKKENSEKEIDCVVAEAHANDTGNNTITSISNTNNADVNHAINSSDDDDNYYVVNEKPKLSVTERLEKLKEKLDNQYEHRHDEWRLRHRIPGRPRTLIKAKSGIVNVLQYAPESVSPKLIDDIPSNQSIEKNNNDDNYYNNNHFAQQYNNKTKMVNEQKNN